MRLDQTVDISAHIDQVWKFLDDVPAVASCMPGAQLTRTVDDSTYEGLVKVAIGPLATNYTGTLTIEERDDAQYTMIMLASGRDRRGSGTAKANVTARLVPNGDHTRLHVDSDVQLTGRVASLGRGVQDVSNKLFAEFADQLATELRGEQTAASKVPPPAPASTYEPPTTAAPTTPPTTSAHEAAAQHAAGRGATIKVGPLLWSITREKLAAFLLRLSKKVSP